MAQPKKKNVARKATPKRSDKTTTPKENKTKYIIENDVPLQKFRKLDYDGRFPFDAMSVGQSFLIPADDPVCNKPHILAHAAKIYARMNPGFKIRTGKQLNGGRRVWRVE